MAGRIRSIKPEWIEDEEFNACSDAAIRMAKVFYALVDDEGRCRASVRALGLAGWKFCDRIIDKTAHAQAAVDELVEAGWLVGYEVDGYQHWQVRNFAKHQKISHFTASKLPAPPEDSGEKPSAPEVSRELRRTPEDAGKLRPDMDLELDLEGSGRTRAREPADPESSRPTEQVIRRAYAEAWGKANAALWPQTQATQEQIRPMVAWVEATAAKERLPVETVVDRLIRHWSRDPWAVKKRLPWATFAKQYANHWQPAKVSPAANNADEIEDGQVCSW